MKTPTKHGGKRQGAGRKRVLSRKEMWDVGSVCEDFWCKACEARLNAERESQPHIKDIRQEQQAFRTARRGARQAVEYSEGIDEIMVAAGSGDYGEIHEPRRRRPYGARPRALEAGVAWCRERYGISITPRRAQACWDEYRKVEKRLKTDLS